MRVYLKEKNAKRENYVEYPTTSTSYNVHNIHVDGPSLKLKNSKLLFFPLQKHLILSL